MDDLNVSTGHVPARTRSGLGSREAFLQMVGDHQFMTTRPWSDFIGHLWGSTRPDRGFSPLLLSEEGPGGEQGKQQRIPSSGRMDRLCPQLLSVPTGLGKLGVWGPWLPSSVVSIHKSLLS